MRPGRYALPFGTIDIAVSQLPHWGNQLLSHFRAADELGVTGLNIRYRRPGLGASLVADANAAVEEKGFQVEREAKIPVTALLRINAPRRALRQAQLSAAIETLLVKPLVTLAVA